MDLATELEGLVAQIPRGRVATIWDLAEGLGDGWAAAAVFRILRDLRPPGAHRAVRASGEPAFPGSVALLRREGVPFLRGAIGNLERLRFSGFDGPRTLARLRGEQVRLSAQVIEEDRFDVAERFAGFDLSYDEDSAVAAAVVTDASGERVVQSAVARVDIGFPYIPGYLAHREFPGIRRCFQLLDPRPHVLLIDGHGRLHPARFGIACLAGVSLDAPAIGVGKHLLVGETERIPGGIGGTAPVRIDGVRVGTALRSSPSRRMVFVSVGHRVSLGTAARLTRRLCRRRIPEPIRLAHILATETKRKMKKKREES